MKNPYIVLLLAFLFAGNELIAQDALTMNDLNFDQSSYNSSFIAQAASPLNASLTTSLGNGAQNTSKVNFLAYANIKKFGFGVGVKLNSKFYGLFKTNSAEFLYSKALKINDDHHLFAGLNIGMHFSSLDRNQFNIHVNYEDPFLTENELPQYRLTSGIGVGYTFKDKFKAGFSMPSFLKNKNEFFPVYVFNASFRKKIPNELTLIPQVLLAGSNISAPTFEGNITIDYKDYLWLKLGGRTTRALVMGLGWHVKFVTVGYNYNLNFAEYAEINPGIHNVNVRLNFNGKKNQSPTPPSHQPFMGQQHDHSELEKQLELLESINAAHEKDKKELEALIAKMNLMLTDIEAANEQAAKQKPEASSTNMDNKDKPENKSSEKEKENTDTSKPDVGGGADADTGVDDKKVISEPAPSPVAIPNYQYYVVVSSLKDENLAREYQQVLEREYNFSTGIVSNEKGSWYFIYMHASDDMQSCKRELSKVKNLSNQKYIQGAPWIYAR